MNWRKDHAPEFTSLDCKTTAAERVHFGLYICKTFERMRLEACLEELFKRELKSKGTSPIGQQGSSTEVDLSTTVHLSQTSIACSSSIYESAETFDVRLRSQKGSLPPSAVA